MKTNLFLSNSGLATKKWGPSGWYFLFSCIMGAYPSQLNVSNKEHLKIKKHFKNMFENLCYIMPCIFCRQSFKQFYYELPIDNFMSSRIELMKWLYLIKDKVNKKLIKQEKLCFNREKRKLKKQYKSKKITKLEYEKLLDKIKKENIHTQKSPPFIDILLQYESIRATCSPKSKTCALNKKTR
jgi:hypothetical protein